MVFREIQGARARPVLPSTRKFRIARPPSTTGPRSAALPRAWPVSGPGNNDASLEAQGNHRIQFCSAVGRKQAKNYANETREDKCKQDDSRADHDRPFTILGDCRRPYRPSGDSDNAAKQSQDRSFDQELIADVLPSRADSHTQADFAC